MIHCQPDHLSCVWTMTSLEFETVPGPGIIPATPIDGDGGNFLVGIQSKVMQEEGL